MLKHKFYAAKLLLAKDFHNALKTIIIPHHTRYYILLRENVTLNVGDIWHR